MGLNRRNNQVTGFPSTASSGLGNRSDNATRWSDMYSTGNGGAVGHVGGGARWLGPVAAVLLIAVIVLSVFGGRAMLWQNKAETTIASRMLMECNSAVDLAESLSSGGTVDSHTVLSRIRAHIRAIDALNEVNNSIGGGYHIAPNTFTSLYATIDSYYRNLSQVGQVLPDRTDLSNGLKTLQQMILAMDE